MEQNPPKKRARKYSDQEVFSFLRAELGVELQDQVSDEWHCFILDGKKSGQDLIDRYTELFNTSPWYWSDLSTDANAVVAFPVRSGESE